MFQQLLANNFTGCVIQSPDHDLAKRRSTSGQRQNKKGKKINPAQIMNSTWAMSAWLKKCFLSCVCALHKFSLVTIH